jgi:hypothetical protein
MNAARWLASILSGCFVTFDAGLGLKRRLAHRVDPRLL